MKTPITYYGGKQRLADTIVSMIPEHRIYCEPYFGGGAVFFRKPPSFLEAINDNNDLLINFYKETQNNFEQLKILVDNSLCSERDFLRAKEIYYGRIESNPLEQAWALWYTLNLSFSGSVYGSWKKDNGTSGSHVGRYFSEKRKIFGPHLKRRLQYVQISCSDALDVIQGRDSENTFFYIDPPYPAAYQQHYAGFTHRDLYELLQILSKLKGKFILSNYWSQTLKFHILKYGWNYETHKMRLSVNSFNKGESSRYRNEILVYNFQPRKDLFSNL